MPKVTQIIFYHDPDTTGVEYIPEMDDEEVCIHLDNGQKFYTWFFTTRMIDDVMRRHKRSGESFGGSFFLTEGMIIVEDISKETIRSVVSHLVESEGDLSLFTEIVD